MRIGLLEDDTAIQEMLRLVLEDEGHTPIIYPTAEECLAALGIPTQEQATLPIDLLIVDWRLSGSTRGTDVIRTLRAHTSYSSLPIILTTAATFSDTDELKKLHVHFLEKPFAVDEMVTMIQALDRPGTLTDG